MYNKKKGEGRGGEERKGKKKGERRGGNVVQRPHASLCPLLFLLKTPGGRGKKRGEKKKKKKEKKKTETSTYAFFISAHEETTRVSR